MENKLRVDCMNCLSQWILNKDSFEDGEFDGIRADLQACPLCWRKDEED